MPWAELWYNTTFHSSAGMTPYQALYGRPPPTIPDYLEGTTQVHDVEQNFINREELLSQLKHNLATAANRMKQAVDKKKQRDVSFQKREMVFVRLQSYRQSSTFK